MFRRVDNGCLGVVTSVQTTFNMKLHSSSTPLSAPRINRRAWLRAGAVGAGGLAASTMFSPLLAQDKDKDKDKPEASKALSTGGNIDAHVHVWPSDTERFPLAPQFSVADMQPPSFPPEELWNLAHLSGVYRVVLIQMSFYGFDNSYMLDAMKRFPGQFSGVAVIDEHAAKPEETMRKLAKQGVRGFRINPGKQKVDEWLGSPGMAAMWKCGEEENLAMCPLIYPDALPTLERMCTQFSKTPVVIDHFARIGLDGVIRDNEVEQLCRLAKFERTHVKTSAFYAFGRKRAPYLDLASMIRRLRDAYGAERLMWASDCPYQIQKRHTYSNSIELIRDRLDFLSASDKEWMLRKTAEKIFFA